MKIQKISCYQVPPRWLFLRLECDNGLVGWGEPVVEGRAATVAKAIEELTPLLLQQDARQISHIWQQVYRSSFYRGGAVLMSALSGLDQALWDVKGKALGVPVYQLLGGACRHKIRAYTWIGGDEPSKLGEEAAAAAERGVSAIKMNVGAQVEFVDTPSTVDGVVDRIRTVREATSPDFGIAVDFHGRVHKAMAQVLLRELEPLRLLFVEEPVLPEYPHVFRLFAHSAVPVATGERLFSRYDFRPLLEDGAVNIVQPDLSHAGGISESLRIVNMAETYDVAFAPHCPLGPLALASCLHLDAVAYNFLIQEQSMRLHYNKGCELLDYVRNPDFFTVNKGSFSLPQGPGLGVEIDEQRVERCAEQPHNWHNALWFYPDGAVAEW